MTDAEYDAAVQLKRQLMGERNNARAAYQKADDAWYAQFRIVQDEEMRRDMEARIADRIRAMHRQEAAP